MRNGSSKFASFCLNLNRTDPPPSTPPPVKTRRLCINLRSDLYQKWGGLDRNCHELSLAVATRQEQMGRQISLTTLVIGSSLL